MIAKSAGHDPRSQARGRLYAVILAEFSAAVHGYRTAAMDMAGA
jgi:hypothetical protein